MPFTDPATASVADPDRETAFIGRVLEASVARFLAVCFALESAPPFGGLVQVDGAIQVYAVVAEVRTEARDPGRRLAPHGGPADDRARVLEQNPHIPSLLHTVFEAIVVGHASGGPPQQGLPAAPAAVFSRVRVCTPAEVAAFTERLDFCSLLLAADPLAGEVTAACLRRAAEAHPAPHQFLVRAGRWLATELAGEPNRLAALLRRIRP